MADSPSSTSGPPDIGSCPAATGLTPEPSRAGRSKQRRFFSVVLIVSLTLNVVGAAAFAARVMRKGGGRYLLEQLDLRDAEHTLLPFQVDWRARLRKLPNTEAEIVFAGDSLIAEGPWSELYCPIKNRGIGGETTSGLLDRLDEVTESQPRKIFLLVGTNCLAADIPVAQVVRNYRKILERVRRESPQTRVFVISVLPVNQRRHPWTSPRQCDDPRTELAGCGTSPVSSKASRSSMCSTHLTDASGDLRKRPDHRWAAPEPRRVPRPGPPARESCRRSDPTREVSIMAGTAKSMILAAGLGTRLRPLTDTIPKCLVPIAGRPLLGYWIDGLCDAGISEARVNTHAHADQVRAYIKRVNAEGRLHLAESFEPELLGSAGTITANADLADGADEVVIVYADNFSDVDLRRTARVPPLARRSVHDAPVPRARSPGLRDRRAG